MRYRIRPWLIREWFERFARIVPPRHHGLWSEWEDGVLRRYAGLGAPMLALMLPLRTRGGIDRRLQRLGIYTRPQRPECGYCGGDPETLDEDGDLICLACANVGEVEVA